MNTLVFTLFMATATISSTQTIITIDENHWQESTLPMFTDQQSGLVCTKFPVFPYVALEPLLLY